ncbi:MULTISPECIES: hypothetical protein [Thioalkalivibrio]|uniref:hypothetical protein n=1 Tax=Thioalkalivibrio TaxID=106633 RepID=UPI00037F9E14|nr:MULTISPECIES: hypothetical protein [Thioalkalivibrio]OOC48929.1 hypothetical protein B0684_06620 [Thioalkalivibrio versutus]
MHTIKLLWTGGWDSSYRLLDLALHRQHRVQPIYVLDPRRKSYVHELRAMATIRAGLESRPEARGRVAPVRVYLRDDILASPDITTLYQRLASEVHVGTQYDWLARLCAQEGLRDLELSLTGHEAGTELQERLFRNPQCGDYRFREDDFAWELFQYYRFPLLSVTKEAMKFDAEAKGFLPLLEQSWFCHSPILGRPCGHCQPCRFSRESNRAIQYSRLGPLLELARRARSSLRLMRTAGA